MSTLDFTAEALIERHNLNVEGFTTLVSGVIEPALPRLYGLPDGVSAMRAGFQQSLAQTQNLPADVIESDHAQDLVRATEAVLDLLDGVEAAGGDINNAQKFLSAVADIGLALIKRDAEAGNPEAQEAYQAAQDLGLL